MSRSFGLKPPSGGLTLQEASLAFASPQALEAFRDADRRWRQDGRKTVAILRPRGSAWLGTRAIGMVPGVHPLRRQRDRTHRDLQRDILLRLRNGSLRAVAVELGSPAADYVEVAPEHWRAFRVTSWERSEVRRTGGAPTVYKVAVYDARTYRAPAASDTDARSIKAKAREIYRQAPLSVRRAWRTRTDAVKWVRNRIDGQGDDAGRRRQVAIVLAPDLARDFPEAPDGIAEK